MSFIPFVLANCEPSSGPSSKKFFFSIPNQLFIFLIPNQRHERMWRFHVVKVGSLRLRGGSDSNSLPTQQAMELDRNDLLRIIEMQSTLIRNQETELRNQEMKERNQGTIIRMQEMEIRMRSGQFYLTFEALDVLHFPVLNHSDPQNVNLIASVRNANPVLKMYLPKDLPKDTNEKYAASTRLCDLATCKYDFWGNSCGPPITAEGAHVLPFASGCVEFFERLNRFRLNMPLRCTSQQDQERYKMWLYGYYVESGSSNTSDCQSDEFQEPMTQAKDGRKLHRVIHSGYLNSAVNFVALRLQHHWFDLFPAMLFIPLKKTAAELWSWFEEPLEFVVVFLNEDVLCDVAANSVVDASGYIACDDPDVKQAFDVFAEVMSVIIGVVCDDDHTNAPEKDNVKQFRNLLKNSPRFQSPRVAAGSQGFFRKVKLNPPRLSYPGRRATPWSNFTGHPSPEPIDMICRSFNAFFSTYLYQRGMLDGLAYRADRPSCKLFPSCLDLEGSIDCNLCLSSFLLHEPFRYSLMTSEEKEKLLSVVNLEEHGSFVKEKYF